MSYEPRYRETVTGASGTSESRDVSSMLQSVETDLKRYQQSVTTIGTSEDNLHIREELVEVRNVIKNKLSTAHNDISQQQQGATARSRIALDKLSKQLQQQLNRYKQTVADHDRRRTAYPLHSSDNDYNYTSDHGPRYNSSHQSISLQVQEQNTDQREREAEELRALERDIVDLNDVFKDVAVMVHDQQEDINRIEDNVGQAGDRVERGNTQLVKAVELARSNRKITCCLITTCLIVIALIIVAIVIAVAVTQSN